jgi:TolB-like protein/DNA-binding winged helix-turn-helix (wHTH) protein/Flp pilus assembly protein TadD
MAGTSAKKGFRFGAFEVDVRTSELRKHGVRIKLQGRPFQILTALIERPGETVSREELRRRLWPEEEFGEFDQSLNTAIKKLRQALGDSATTPRFVETQARSGYRFVAQVQSIEEGGEPPPVILANAYQPRRKASSRSRWIMLAATLLALVTFVVLWRTQGRGTPSLLSSGGRITSIAVLPLLDLASKPEQDYFADGLTDALITNLSKIGALRVISRTSAMQYKATKKLLPEIGRELKVDAVVEGTVQRQQAVLRVTVKLIRAATEENLLTETFERDPRDVLALENEMAAAIARKIEIRLTPQESVHLRRSRQLDPEAYESYLKGRFFWNIRSDDGLHRAIRYFEQALARDPTYSLAYAGLADCYNMLSFYGPITPAESMPKAKAAALKALELDDNLAEAHAALAYARLHYDWDWQGAEIEFRRALDANPGYANAHHWRSHYLLATGRTQDALAAAKHALELDPLNLSINAHVAHQLLYLKKYEQAISQLQKTIELNPSAARAHALLAHAFEGQSMFDRAESEIQQAMRLSSGNPEFEAELAHVYAAEGKAAIARQHLATLERRSRYASPYSLAVVHAALGDRDGAFAWLGRGFEARPQEMIYVKVDPRLENLHSDPRFAELLRRMAL